ncbi:diphthamide biosynthesis enzyme Dph2 [Thermogladius sp.]|uniref:diphthamide biosynthesis enzyme Dph2 n=1 Tax=Thermogladius sp. TaxID=2023064 RepID=UPI003D129170
MKCDTYIVEESLLVEELSSIPVPRPRVLLQAPDGLKKLYDCLGGLLRKVRDVEVYYSASPSFGACDIPLEEVALLRPDLVVHIGHAEYPLAEVEPPLRVVYVPVYYDVTPRAESLLEIEGSLSSRSWRRVAVVSPLTERLVAKRVADYLSSRGFDVREAEDRPILGCDYRSVISLAGSVDGFLLVSGGLFHALGAALYTDNLLAYDPYREKVWDPSVEARKLIRERIYTVVKLRNQALRRAVVVAGARPGQFRPSVLNMVAKLLEKIGVEYVVTTVSYLTLDRLLTIDETFRPDFIVVTSCPRLPLDDFHDFHKPVLTPGELAMLVWGVEKYVFPW